MADLSLVFDLLARDRASSEVDKVGDSMKGAGNQADGFGDHVSGMFATLAAGAAGAGLAVGAAFASALESQGANTKLTAQLGLNPDESAAAGKLAGGLYAQNYGDSLSDVNDAIAAVRNNIGTEINDADMSAITGKTLDLASAFGVDVADSTKAVGNLIETGLAKNAGEALDIVTNGFQSGNDAAGDWLDTLNEYSVQFSKLGISGEAATNLISQGMQAGARDSDLVADAIKEFSLRAVDGSKTTAAGFEAIGLNAGDMATKIGAGGATANGALESVFQSLRAMTDPVAQAQAATALFGSQAEDLGGALFALDPASAGAAQSIAGVAGASDRLDATLASGIGPRLESLKRGAQQAASGGMLALINGFTQGKTDADGWQGGLQNLAASVSGTLGPALSVAAGFLTGTVAPALGSVFGFLSDHSTTVTVIAGLIAGLLTPAVIAWGVSSLVAGAQSAAAWVMSALGASAGAIASVASAAVVVGSWVLMGVQALLGAARMAAAWLIALGPIGLVIAAVVGIVALIIANWDTIVNATQVAWDAVTGALGAAWEWIKGAVSAAAQWVVDLFLNWTLPGLIIKHWDTIKQAFSTAIDAVVGFVAALPGKAVAALSSLGSSIAGAASSAWSLFAGAVQTGIATVVTLVTNIPGSLLHALGNVGTLLVSVGGDLLRGLWDGINGSIAWLKGKVTSFFGSLLPGWAKDMLGIASPSKVFAEFGRFTMQGFAAGIGDGSSTVLDAVHGVLSDATAIGANLAADVQVRGSSGLAYRPPGYDTAATAGAAPTTNITTTINAAPTIPTEDQLAGVYRRATLLAPRRG